MPASLPPLAVDATALRAGRKGLGRFQERLLEALAVHLPQEAQLTVILGPDHDAVSLPAVSGWNRVVCRSRYALVRELWEIPRATARAGAEVLLTTSERVQHAAGARLLLYLFEDPRYRTRQATFGGRPCSRARLADAATNALWRTGIRRADHIVCASTSTARDLFYWRGVDAARLSVAQPGVLQRLPGASARREPRVVAFVDRDPRDNGRVAVEVLQRLPAEWEAVVVGDAPEDVRSHAAGTAIRFTGRISAEELGALLHSSSLYLDVSLYEGFGSQAVEAAQAGLGCVVAGVTSLPEVTAFGARYLDPHDAESAWLALRFAIEQGPGRVVPDVVPDEERWAALVAHLSAMAYELRAGMAR